VSTRVCTFLCYWPQDLTDRERLGLHAEIKALQGRLGLSYKDAAHRLYIAEIEKLNMTKRGYKAFSSLQSHVESRLLAAHVVPSEIETDSRPRPDADADADADADSHTPT